MSVLQQHLFPQTPSSNAQFIRDESLLNESVLDFNQTSSDSSSPKRKAVIVCGARTPFVKAFSDMMEVGLMIILLEGSLV